MLREATFGNSFSISLKKVRAILWTAQNFFQCKSCLFAEVSNRSHAGKAVAKFNTINYNYNLSKLPATFISAAVSTAVKIDILENIPEIETSVRIFDLGQFGERSRVMVDDKVFIDDKVFFADASFFEVFSFRLLKGNSKHALQKQNGVVLTEQLAEKYFGSEDPVGKSLGLSGNKNSRSYRGVSRFVPTIAFPFRLIGLFEKPSVGRRNR